MFINRKPRDFSKTATGIGTSNTDIGNNPEILMVGATELVIELANEGALLLADFVLMVKAHADGAWKSLLATTDWNTPGNVLRRVATAPQTLAAEGVSQAHLIVGPVHSVKFQCKGGSGSNVVTNGDMSADTGWTLDNMAIAAGVAASAGAGDYSLTRTVTLKKGTYLVSIEVTVATGDNSIGSGILIDDVPLIAFQEDIAAVGTYTGEIDVPAAGDYTFVIGGAVDTALTIDNVTMTPSKVDVTVRGQAI